MKKIFLLFKLIFKIIDKKFKKFFFINILFNLFSNFIQVLGLSSAIPFITILINPELVQTNKYLNTLYNNFNFQSNQITLYQLYKYEKRNFSYLYTFFTF